MKQMTKQEIAVLGHAFFDGKTLQYQIGSQWATWEQGYCPDLRVGEWRIKLGEPKTITICTFFSERGVVSRFVKDSYEYNAFGSLPNWTHIKSLDQVVEVE